MKAGMTVGNRGVESPRSISPDSQLASLTRHQVVDHLFGALAEGGAGGS